MIYLVCLTAVAWLIPNHYYPWTSAWGDGLAIFGILFTLSSMMLDKGREYYISSKLIIFSIFCLIAIVTQFSLGKILYLGDAWITILYVLMWLAAVFVGNGIATPAVNKSGVINAIMSAWILAAIFSVGIALVQWLDAFSLGIYGVEMPYGGRPYANVAQPNNLCTLCFVGLCSLLWMYQRNIVKGIPFWAGVIFLVFGMVMTQSRTGWLQMILLIIWRLWVGNRVALKINFFKIIVIGVVFLFLTIIWPILCDALFLSSGRPLDEQIKPGARLPYWLSMLDAIGHEPLWGYGWNQVGMAQQRVALDYPVGSELFEHSHNFFLDLILWNGVPVGIILILILVWWLFPHIRDFKNSSVALVLISLGGIVVHGMLEFPLEYAYFLIPVGLMMGIVDGFSQGGKIHLIKIPYWFLLLFCIFLSSVFLITTKDYLKAEESYRDLRAESARIGFNGEKEKIPNLNVLTQLEEFLKFMQLEATPGMTAKQLENMKKISGRFGYPPVLFRYALASGINGNALVAKETLKKICHIYGDKRCAEARENWAILQSKHRELRIIEFPSL